MNLLYSLYLTVNPAPIEGDLKPGLEEGDITPGLLGFLATLFLALCVVFLIRDMVKRIRRVRYRAQAAEAQAAGASVGAADEASEDSNESEDAAGTPASSEHREPAGKLPGADTDG